MIKAAKGSAEYFEYISFKRRNGASEKFSPAGRPAEVCLALQARIYLNVIGVMAMLLS